MTSTQQILAATRKAIVEEEIDIKSFLEKYIFHYWYLYLLFVSLGIVFAYTYLKFSTPVYEIKSQLLIKEDKEKYFRPEDQLLKDLNSYGASENVSNEIQILSSFSLMEKVVSELNLNLDFHYRYWIKSIPVYKDFPILLDTFSLNEATLYSSDYRNSGLSFQIKPFDYQRFELIHKGIIIDNYSFGEVISNEFGTFKFFLKPPFNFTNDSTVHVTIKDPELAADEYLKNLSVGLIDTKATMVGLTLKEAIPEKGIAILNALIHFYNKKTIEEKNKITRNSLKFINERLDGITAELNSVERNVEQYKQSNKISTEVTKNLEIVMQEMSKYTDEQTDLEVQLSILESMNAHIENSPEFSLIPANLSITSTALVNLIEPYNALVLKRQQLQETANPSNPLLLSNAQQLKSLESIIRTTITNLKEDFRKKLRSIESLNKDLAGRLQKVPTQERGLLEIKRQQSIKENLFLFLLQKREETALSLIATTANSRTIDEPRVNRQKISPKNSLIYLGSIFGGLLFPFFLVFGKEFFQTSIRTEEEIKALTTMPIIGGISRAKKGEIIAVKRNSRTAVAEHFRLIRANLQFLRKKEKHTILITSSVSGEGKTFVAINLALSFTLTKQKRFSWS